jgi:MoxR-like ATPase
VLITSNNEKELPDAFLRRCIFHFIEFPDPKLMREILAVHHPHLDVKLLDQVLIKFYWLREQSELRKRPSTSELIDWISALLRSGISPKQLEEHLSACPPCVDFLKTYRATPSLCRRALQKQMPQEMASKLSDYLRAKLKK